MRNNLSDCRSKRSRLPLIDEAGESADPGSAEPRVRREFLRRLVVTGVAVPLIGGTSLAADHKRKSKEKADGSSSSAASSGGGTPNTSHPRTASKSSGRGPASARSTPHPRDEPIGHGNRPIENDSAETDRKTVNPGKPLPELYKRWNIEEFEQIQADENAHVAFLVNALGSYARPMPIFQGLEQDKVHEFAVVSRTLENTGVGAYLGAIPVLASTQLGQTYLAAAGSIAFIEARHAGYLNTLLDLNIVENITGNVSSFDAPLTPQAVVALASPFIASLNGGPPLIPAGGLVNAIDILNFALALEFLEAEFYNINVPNLRKVLSE